MIAVGYADRSNTALRSSLAGLVVVLDVQHLYQPAKPKDRGALFTLLDGSHVYETQASTAYAGHAGAWLASRGARVITNDPAHGILVGPYWTRNRAAAAAGAHAYLACHVNAGGGDYFLAEYMLGTNGAALGTAIGSTVRTAFPVIHGAKLNPLQRGQRGAVCIEAVDAKVAAIVLEPFFGDRALHEDIFDPEALARLGAAVGEGVAAWWMGIRPAA